MQLRSKARWWAAAAGATALAAASVLGTVAVQAAAPVTVTIWSWRSQDAGMWQQVQKQLRAQGDNITIQYRPVNSTSYDSVLQTAMDGGKGPDIFYGRAGTGTFDYAAAGMIAPMNGKVSFKSFVPSSLAAVAWNGKDWGVPLDEETMQVFYNKQIFAQYHLSPPQTWAQWMHICQVLQAHHVTPIYTEPIQTWMLALNLEQISSTTFGDAGAAKLVAKKLNFESKPYIQALTDLKSLTKYFEPNFMAVGSNGNEQEVAMGTGRGAMVMDGIYDIGTMIQYGMKMSNLGQFPMPMPNASAKPVLDWYPDGDLAMNAKISNPAVRAAAMDIMKFATTAKFGTDFTGVAGEISPIKGVTIPSKYPLSIQAYQWYQKEAVNPLVGIRSPMDSPPPVPVTSKKVSTDLGIFTAETDEVQPLLSGKATVQQVAAAIQKDTAWYFK